MRNLILLLLLVLSPSLYAGQKYTISGKVTDITSGEELIGVTIYNAELAKGAITNSYGFYSLSFPEGKYTIRFSFIGYEPVEIKLNLNKNFSQNIELNPMSEVLNEVTVTAQKANKNVSSAVMSAEKINIKKIDVIPVIFGEKDILKTIQLTPGISSTSEGSSGYTVRGGSTDQNLILLDEAPVYNASHLMGFFSVFNSDALKDAQIYKGGIPANYGGRASSVLDVKMNNGNMKEFHGSGGIGLISSRLMLEGPIVKDKLNFMISGRRTYADLIVNQFEGFEDINMYFYDLNAKLNYTINENNRLYLSGYFGKDVFGMDRMGFSWGNTTSTLRWNHLFNDKLFSNTSLIFSDYNYDIGVAMNSFDMNIGAGIRDYNFKEDFWYYHNPNNTIKFGMEAVYHQFDPGQFESSTEGFTNITIPKKQALESSVYLLNEQKIGEHFNLNYGLRVNCFNLLGEGTVYDYDNNHHRTDSTVYASGNIIQTYLALEPRISMNYMFSNSSSVKLSYNRMTQNMHLISNSTSSQPTDIWLPSSNVIKPQINNQIAGGYFQNFWDNTLEFSSEVYYKNMQNVIDYENGTDILLNEDIEDYMLEGKGRSYGLELYLKKTQGRFSGWISYTLSRTEHLFPEIQEGWYPAKQDKTHDVSLVGTWQINKRFTLSATWVFATGNAVTLPSGQYSMGDQMIPYYTERNGYRMPDYHRLDVGLTIKGKETKRFKSSWNISIYNAYNQYNAYSISFEESQNTPGTFDAVQLSLFGIVPSVSYNFNF